jgi:hypothetical protein
MKKDYFLTDSIVAYLDALTRNNPEWGFPEISRQFDLMCEKANLSPTMVNLGYYYMGILTCEKMAKEKLMGLRRASLN